ncbi:uncharacterized protein LOC143284968 [Babylonia areolata]|uniref:uncharacterized protein LOC143284968 n=1 Tax=Babylonia areolata TaxID=304850 RepID=UPI003FCF87D2
MGIRDVLREEFQRERLWFAGIQSERLCISQWRVPVEVCLIYRALVMVYAVACLMYMASHPPNLPYPLPAYLTTWAYFLLCLYLLAHLLTASVLHVSALVRGRDLYQRPPSCCTRPSVTIHASKFVEAGTSSNSSSSDNNSSSDALSISIAAGGGREGYQTITESDGRFFSSPWYLCVVWVLFDVASVLALTVTTAYFAFLFHGGGGKHLGALDFSGVQAHVLNSVLVLIEQLVTALPFRLLHVVYPFLFSVAYLVFSIVYWADEHSRVIYPGILDWNRPGLTVVYVLLTGFLFLPLFHAVLFLVYKGRVAVYMRC